MPYLITGLDKRTKQATTTVSNAPSEALARKSADALGIEVESIVAVEQSSDHRPTPQRTTNKMSGTASKRKSGTRKTILRYVGFGLLLIAAAIIFCVWQRSPKDIFDAALKGDTGAVAKFLAAGVDPNSQNNVKDIPLHLATTKEVAELLISKGSKIDQPNTFGGTPLHMAAVNGRPDVAAVLIDHGADVNALDVVGATPLDHAIIGREKHAGGGDYDGVIRLLQSKGAIARRYGDKLK